MSIENSNPKEEALASPAITTTIATTTVPHAEDITMAEQDSHPGQELQPEPEPMEDIQSALQKEAGSESTEDASAQATTKKVCCVCKDKVPKYKCSICELPYCSVVCSRIHKVNHPPTEPKPQPKPQEVKVLPPSGRAGTLAGAARVNPFATLDDAKELKTLFQIYPKLKAQLLKIDKAAQASQSNGQKDTRQKGGRNNGAAKGHGPLNQDPGLQNGLKALYVGRASDDGEGVREYGKLILSLLNKTDDLDAAVLVHREVEEESAQFVALLLQAEQSR